MTDASSSTPNELDLAFIIDATSSMSPYIKSAQQNMRKIIEDIIRSERCLLNAALILYRDHPPQDNTFVIQVNDFTDDAEEAKKNIDAAYALGGGDCPEAIAPALHAAVHTLSWRANAVKIAVLIADAPPHGLTPTCGDSWPNGDPSGHDPVECVALLAERGVTLYTIGCEPPIVPYRDFFMAMAFKTGGQYIPLADSANLAPVIVGSAREEISLERLIAQVHEEVMREAAARGGPVDEAELTRRIHDIMHSGGAKVRRLKMENKDGSTTIPALTANAEELSTLKTLKEVREKWTENAPTTVPFPTFATGGLFGFGLGLGKTPAAGPRVRALKKAKRTAAPVVKKTLAKRKAVPAVKPVIKKKTPRKVIPHGNRRSLRLVLKEEDNEEEEKEESIEDEEEEESIDDEEMDTTTPPPISVAKPARLKTEVSSIDLKEDELLDITQTRRLVRKCVARNKLTST